MRYRRISLNSDASQPTQDHSTSAVAPPPTLVEWFATTIEVTNNPGDHVGCMFAINGAMAVMPDISEAIVIKILPSKGLQPKGTNGGKMAQKRVFTGARPKSAKEQFTVVSPPQDEEFDVEAHTRMGQRSRVLHQMKEAQCILHHAMFFDDGDAIFFHQDVASRKRGANGKPVRE